MRVNSYNKFSAEVAKSVVDVMQCLMCPADREGNRCCGGKRCKQTWKRYDAICNPEWHHVSLATLANIDFDMLDEKHKSGGYTIFAYNNAVAFNGDNVYSNELGALAYQCKNYGNANVYKLDVETIGWKNRKEK